jgi:cell division protein ZapA
MGQVTVTIAGKLFRMACDDGQEPHLQDLAASVDKKIGDLRAAFGDIGDQRLVMMAAIAIADEASVTSRRLAKMEEDIAALQRGRGEDAAGTAARSRALAETLTGLATRIERINEIVEGRAEEL